MDERLISLNAAIDALDKVAEMFPYRIPGKAKTYRQYNEAWSDAIDAAENALEALPSAQPSVSKLEMVGDAVSRQAAVETVRKAKSIGQAHRMLAQMPSAQPTCTVFVPVDDCISRQAAIKTLMAAKTVDPSIVGCASNAGVDWCIDAIKALPSAQPTDRNGQERT